MNVFKIFTIFLLVLHSCSNSDVDTPEEIQLNSVDVELSLDLKSVEGVYFKTSNLELFTSKFSKDFIGDTSFYILISDDITTIKFSNQTDEAINDININARSSVSITCSTSRSEKYVEDKIKEAFDKNDAKNRPVYIATKPIKTFGVTTGIKVCYSNTPIEASQLYVQPIELTSDDLDLGDSGMISIDNLLEIE